MSRSDKRRIAIQKGEPMPTFSKHGTDDTDIDRAKYIFEKLKREGECNHRTDSGYFDQTLDEKIYPCHSKCGKNLKEFHVPMNFFAPSSEEQGWIQFGWMWERIQADDIWTPFKLYYGQRGLSLPSLAITSCAPLAEALYSWFKDQDE